MMMNTLAAAAAVLVGFASASAQVYTSTVTNDAPYQSRRPLGGAEVYGSDPKTVLTYSGDNMSVYVREYDEGTSSWSAQKKIYTNFYDYPNAYHNYPTIIRAPNGRLLVFYFYHDQEGFQLSAPFTNSIDGVWSRKQILDTSERPGYPMPVVAGNDIYLFYRHKVNNVYRTTRYIKSSDNGQSWSSPVTAIDTQNRDGTGGAGGFNEIYHNDIAFETGRAGHPDRLRMSFHLAGDGGHNARSRGVYFGYFNLDDETWESPDGTYLGSVLDYGDLFSRAAATKLLVDPAMPTSSDNKPVNSIMPTQKIYSSSDQPIIGYNINGGGTAPGNDTKPYTATFTNGSWQINGFGSGLDNWELKELQKVNGSVIGAVLVKHDQNKIRFYETSNAGAGWSLRWEKNVASEMINGADWINTVTAIGSVDKRLDLYVTTADFSERTTKSRYNDARWRVFTINH